MKIWLISKYASSPLYGYPTRQFFFAKTFAEKFGCDVTLISSRSLGFTTSPDFGWKNSLNYKYDNLNGVVLNGPKIKSGMSLLRIYSWLIFEIRLLLWAYQNRKNKPDVIIVSSLSLFTFLTGSFLKSWFDCKLVTEVRDIWPLTIEHMMGLSKKNLLIRFMSFVEKRGYKNANVIIGSIANLQQHVKNITPGLESKVKYIPTGFDIDFFSKNEGEDYFNAYFSRINPNRHFVVSYVGTIGLVNRVDQIVDAAILLKNEEIVFVVLGNGPQKEKLLKKVAELRLMNVHFHPAVPRNQVQAFLKHSDLNVNPIPGDNPVYQFGVSPNKWIDYMYSEKPLVVSLNGYHNIINEANCGTFIKSDDLQAFTNAVMRFKQMPLEQRVQIGKNGKEYLLTHLTYEILANQYLNYIRHAV